MGLCDVIYISKHVARTLGYILKLELEKQIKLYTRHNAPPQKTTVRKSGGGVQRNEKTTHF